MNLIKLCKHDLRAGSHSNDLQICHIKQLRILLINSIPIVSQLCTMSRSLMLMLKVITIVKYLVNSFIKHQ